ITVTISPIVVTIAAVPVAVATIPITSIITAVAIVSPIPITITRATRITGATATRTKGRITGSTRRAGIRTCTGAKARIGAVRRGITRENAKIDTAASRATVLTKTVVTTRGNVTRNSHV